MVDPMFHTPDPIRLLFGIDLCDSFVLSNKFQLQLYFMLRKPCAVWFSAVHSNPSCFNQAIHLQLLTLSLSNYFTSLYTQPQQVSPLSINSWLASGKSRMVSGAESKQFTGKEKQCEDFFSQTTSRTADQLRCTSNWWKLQPGRATISGTGKLQSTCLKQDYTEYIKGYKDAGHIKRSQLKISIFHVIKFSTFPTTMWWRIAHFTSFGWFLMALRGRYLAGP